MEGNIISFLVNIEEKFQSVVNVSNPYQKFPASIYTMIHAEQRAFTAAPRQGGTR